MPLVSEFFNGGLVTARDPALLKEGELQQANECIYRAHDPAIYRAPGRTVYNTTVIKDATGTTCAVKGLRWMPFGNGQTAKMVALGGNGAGKGTLWSGDFTVIDGSATFTLLTGPGQVTDVMTTNASPTITSASGGFVNMLQGARVYGTGIPNGAVVKTLTSSTSIDLSINSTATSVSPITATFDMGIVVSPADTGPETLDAVQWQNTYYAFTGKDASLAIYNKIPPAPYTTRLISRTAGLDPVTLQPTVTKVAGTWPAISPPFGNGWYWILITEVFNAGQADEVEGTYAPKDVNGTSLAPVSFEITDYTTQSVVVYRPVDGAGSPVQFNDGSRGRLSTSWYVYMTPMTDDGTNVPALPLFRRVAQVSITQASVSLTDTSTLTNTTQTGYPLAQTTWQSRPAFDTPANILNKPDNKYTVAFPGESILLKNFGFIDTGSYGSSALITGIKVTLYGFTMSGFGGITSSCYVTPMTSTGKQAYSTAVAMSIGQLSTQSFGGQFETLGVAWSYLDVVDGTFQIAIDVVGGDPVFFDAVQVIFYYTGGSLNMNGAAFRVVTYQDQIGTTLDVPARFPPPIASTGDVFQGSLVTNNVSDDSILCWSLPGEPEAFPSPYQLKFEQRRRNKITFIRKVGPVLIVGMSDAVKRVNYLPSENDTDMQEGLAHEDIASDHGIVGPFAATLFTLPGMGEQLAYLAQNGLHVTDGVTSRFLNLDISWSALVDPANSSKCILRNYPREQWLVLYYPPVGGSGLCTRALIFNYSSDKIKYNTIPNSFYMGPPMLAAIGPVSVSGRCAEIASLNGQFYLFTGHQTSGLIYIEDNAIPIPAGYTTDGVEVVVGAPSIITRRFYPAGIDRNSREERLYLHYGSTGTTILTTNCTFTANSPTVTMSSTTGLVKGMLITAANVPGDAIILSVNSGSQITMSVNATDSGVVSTSFDNGTILFTVRRQNIGENTTVCSTAYNSMLVGSLLVVHPDNQGQALELQIDKVMLPDLSRVDAGVDMKLNFFAYDMADAGKEQNRTRG